MRQMTISALVESEREREREREAETRDKEMTQRETTDCWL